MFEKKLMISGGTMWDQTEGCAKQYRYSVAYYLMYFLSRSYQIVIYRAVDTPDHGKYIVDGFNAVQKRYLSTCLIMHITPEVDKTDTKYMHVDDMTEKLESSFAK